MFSRPGLPLSKRLSSTHHWVVIAALGSRDQTRLGSVESNEGIYGGFTLHSDGSVFVAGALDSPGALLYVSDHVQERPFFRTHMTLAIR